VYIPIHKASWWPEPSFIATITVSALGSAALRAALRKYVVHPLARKKALDKAALRLEESFMQVIFYSFAWSFNAMFLVRQTWFWNPILTFLDGFPRQPAESEIRWFYGLQAGWYVHCSYAHLFQDIKKSDHWVTTLHHGVTLTLLYAAFVTGYFRIGMLVMFAMDICDVFVFSAKALKILDRDSSVHPILYLAAYATLPTVWFLFRLVYFPCAVMYTTLVGTIQVYGWERADGWIPFNALLSILLALNILRVGYLSLCKGNPRSLDDIREQDQDHRQTAGKISAKLCL
jgi:hypothetical protein